MSEPMSEEPEDLNEPWLNEFLFALGVTVFGTVYFWQARLITVEQGGVNARTLPTIMAGAILLYGLSRVIRLLLDRPERTAPARSGPSTILHVVLPLTLEMVAYVQLIHWIGYLLATFVIMLAVFWTFGLRKPVQMVLLSAAAAVVTHVLFVGLLAVWMPEGALIDLKLM